MYSYDIVSPVLGTSQAKAAYHLSERSPAGALKLGCIPLSRSLATVNGRKVLRVGGGKKSR